MVDDCHFLILGLILCERAPDVGRMVLSYLYILIPNQMNQPKRRCSGGPNGKGRWRAMPFDPRLAMPNGMPSMGSYWSILEKLCEAIHAIWHAKWGMPNGKSMPNDKPTNHRPPFVHLPNGMKPKWHESIRLHTSSEPAHVRAHVQNIARGAPLVCVGEARVVIPHPHARV